MVRFSEEERLEVWDRWQAGDANRLIGRDLGRSAASIRAFVESWGGVRQQCSPMSVVGSQPTSSSRIWPISAGTGLDTKLGRTATPALGVGEQTADPPLKRQAIPPLSPEFGGPH